MLDDIGPSLLAYSDLFLVDCPVCESWARIFTPSHIKDQYQARMIGHEPKRFLCEQCGFTKDIFPKKRWDNIWAYDFELFDEKQAADWYFGYPLFLQTPCCGHTLWFFNFEHLTHVEQYIAQKIRPPELYYMSIESRLPKWMKSSKNRKEVLQAIYKLKKKIK